MAEVLWRRAERQGIPMIAVLAALLFSACSGALPSVVAPTQAPESTAQAIPVREGSTQTATAMPPAVTNSPAPVASNSAAPRPSRTAAPTVTVAASPSNTARPLLPAPTIVKPGPKASYSWKSPVIFGWTWSLPLQADEFFQLQFSREGTPLGDFACTRSTTFLVDHAPFGYGWYQWRVLVRRGAFKGTDCKPAGDVSMPTDVLTLEWREPPESVVPTPPPRSYP